MRGSCRIGLDRVGRWNVGRFEREYVGRVRGMRELRASNERHQEGTCVPGWSTEAGLPPGVGLLALRMAPILGIIIVLPGEERRHEPELSWRRHPVAALTVRLRADGIPVA